MSHRLLPTISEWPRVMKCVGSAVLPVSPVEGGEDAQRGDAIHAFLAAIPKIGRDAALAKVPTEWREDCSQIDTAGLPISGAIPELAIGLHMGTTSSREIGRDLAREYGPREPLEIVGTIDGVWASAHAGSLWDYKTGHSEQDPAAEHWQLLVAAVILWRLWGVEAWDVSIIQINPDGSNTPDHARLDLLDLVAAEQQLKDRVAEIVRRRAEYAAGVMPPTVAGKHCRYCPAWPSCPQKLAIARRVLRDPASFEPPALSTLTPEQLTEWKQLYDGAKEVIGRIGAEIASFAAFNDIPIGDGRVYGSHEVKRLDVDGEVAFRVVHDRFGVEAAAAAVTMKGTQAGLIRAAKVAKVPVVAAAVRELLAEIKTRGGVAMKTQTRIEEHVKAKTASEPARELARAAP